MVMFIITNYVLPLSLVIWRTRVRQLCCVMEAQFEMLTLLPCSLFQISLEARELVYPPQLLVQDGNLF